MSSTPIEEGAVRESSMPESRMWESFFDADGVLGELGFRSEIATLELGAGYGTFTVAAAKLASRVVAVEFDRALVSRLSHFISESRLSNVIVRHADLFQVVGENIDVRYDAVLLFNIMHMKHPLLFIDGLRTAMSAGAMAYVIHWRTDIDTPRGPSNEIRTSPELCARWFSQSGFLLHKSLFLKSAPYHFGQVYKIDEVSR